ncbi:hypothetical protein AcW2_000607 [Taiwanofungus camphoratus]|nr:hypothetical protein AcW2_000607 [Antrodia cinnamomea]
MDFGFGKDVLWDVRGLSIAGRYRRGPSPSLSRQMLPVTLGLHRIASTVVLAASHLLAVHALLKPHRACRFGHLPVVMDIGVSARAPHCVHTGLPASRTLGSVNSALGRMHAMCGCLAAGAGTAPTTALLFM